MIRKVLGTVFVMGMIAGALEWVTLSSSVWDSSKSGTKKAPFVWANAVAVNSVTSPALGNKLFVYITNRSGKKIKKAEVEASLVTSSGATIKKVKSTIDDDSIMPGECFKAVFSTSENMEPIRYDNIRLDKVTYFY